MEELLRQVKADMDNLVDEWLATGYLQKGDIFVVGCSTSEVAGKKIGTSGSREIAEVIFSALLTLKEKAGIHLAFQSCEHINRAIVTEKVVQERLQLDPVSVVPVRSAGGAMSEYAYQHLPDAVVVEEIKAHAGIDIGNTLIGMHLKQVAVPLRFKQQKIGNAHLTAARTRPKLIGGPRAQYDYK